MADATDQEAKTIADGLAQCLDLAASRVRVVSEVVHVLTHRRMMITVVRAELPVRARVSKNAVELPPYDAFVLADPSARKKLACATLTKKLIVAAQ